MSLINRLLTATQNPEESKHLSPLQISFVLAVYFLASFVFTQLAVAYGPHPNVSLIFPVAALDIALPLIFGVRWIPAIFLNSIVRTFLENSFGFGGLSLLEPTIYLYSLLKMLFYGGAAWFLLKIIKITANLARLKDVSWFLFIGVLVAPFLLACLVVPLYIWHGIMPNEGVINIILSFWAGDATGVALLAPMMLSLQRISGKNLHFPKVLRAKHATLTFLLSLPVLLGFVLLVYQNRPNNFLDTSYLIFLPMLLVAIRSGFRRTTIAVCVLNIMVLVSINYRPTNPELLVLQFNLLAVSCVSLLVSAVFTDYHRRGEHLQYRAYHDVLTGLPNRAYLLEHLELLSLQKAGRFALFSIDLDRFKNINDTYGHKVGDAFLILIARRFTDCLDKEDKLIRLGGDEFAALLANVKSNQEVLDKAKRMMLTLEETTVVEGYNVKVDASIGIAIANAEDPDTADLFQKSDTALREAKAAGRASFTLFDNEMQNRISQNLELERGLRLALEKGELEVHYQPIRSLDKDCVVGVEALMRWHKEGIGYVPPLNFIPIAEDTGLIFELSEWLMRAAFTQGPKGVYIAINLSVRQLQQRGFVERVKRLLDETEFPVERLVFEVTESMVMTDLEAIIKVLAKLSRLGVRIAMDDFGTGYASLSYLKRLPIHTLKIDRSFLRGVPDDESDVSLVGTILAMAQGLNLRVVAEGVETIGQESFLRAQGCDQVQGYLYGRPLPLRDLEVFLKA